MLRIMPREMRLMGERILSLTGQPKGLFLSLVDIVMYSQKLDAGGFALLENALESFKAADPTRIAIKAEEQGAVVLDANQEHAWFVLPVAVDLLGELVSRFGRGEVTVENSRDPKELIIAAELGRRSGLEISLDRQASGDALRLTAVARPLTGDFRQDEPLLAALMDEGTPIHDDLWWRIYHLARTALAPDTVVSRRHAGPLIVNEDGSVIGRTDNDDDTDVSFLTKSGRDSERRQGAGA
ncbi:hypothetical protein [Rhizobium sp. SSA_523]|uniref:hypothetical protein n=1 Tax=Rhizobium sp. SSA_523 TaxID=2952477 RepID=UPI0020913C8A|nr:hypothetical protein [Rhizobium sp. SSA_523]MCO5732183.1 hypothetical protein [Rhizobium sp. SSA_523]WKC21402.1 hypothetical protein QTJ18_05855 [Rhizobium sp. SSA_523]